MYGEESSFGTLSEAVEFLGSYSVYEGCGNFRKYEIAVRFSNGDTISASLRSKEKALSFLRYVGGDKATTYG